MSWYFSHEAIPVRGRYGAIFAHPGTAIMVVINHVTVCHDKKSFVEITEIMCCSQIVLVYGAKIVTSLWIIPTLLVVVIFKWQRIYQVTQDRFAKPLAKDLQMVLTNRFCKFKNTKP